MNVVLASGLGASNVTRGWQFFARTHVFPGHSMLFLLVPAETLGVLGIVAVWSTAVEIC